MGIEAGIHQILVRIANREDPGQTASSEAVGSGSVLSVFAYSADCGSVRNFRTFTVAFAENAQNDG